MLERKKPKPRSPIVTESWSFLVRYIRTYVLNKKREQKIVVLIILVLYSQPPLIPRFEINMTRYTAMNSRKEKHSFKL